MSFAVSAVVAGAAIVYNQIEGARKAQNAAADALKQQQQQNAAATLQAQTNAAIEADSVIAAQKRAYRANALALGGTRDDSLGNSGSVLASGATTKQSAAGVQPTTSVLGGGSPVTSSAVRQPASYS